MKAARSRLPHAWGMFAVPYCSQACEKRLSGGRYSQNQKESIWAHYDGVSKAYRLPHLLRAVITVWKGGNCGCDEDVRGSESRQPEGKSKAFDSSSVALTTAER